MRIVIVGALVVVGAVSGKFYFKEDFNDIAWKERWTAGTEPSAGVIADAQAVPHMLPISYISIQKDVGEWKWTAGEFHGDPNDKGVQTTGNAHFHRLAAELDEPCYKMESDLVIQMSVKYEQGVCGGEISIILGGDRGPFTFGDDASYHAKFTIRETDQFVPVNSASGRGGRSTGTEIVVPPAHTVLTHLYTLVIKPDSTYYVSIDNGVWGRYSGTLERSLIGEDCTHIAIEARHRHAGVLLDDIIVTDSLEEAQAYARATWSSKGTLEQHMFRLERSARRARDGIGEYFRWYSVDVGAAAVAM
jgi:hypothetical protein